MLFKSVVLQIFLSDRARHCDHTTISMRKDSEVILQNNVCLIFYLLSSFFTIKILHTTNPKRDDIHWNEISWISWSDTPITDLVDLCLVDDCSIIEKNRHQLNCHLATCRSGLCHLSTTKLNRLNNYCQ